MPEPLLHGAQIDTALEQMLAKVCQGLWRHALRESARRAVALMTAHAPTRANGVPRRSERESRGRCRDRAWAGSRAYNETAPNLDSSPNC